MTRPEIIRADSIDLQDRDAPSAQDHAHAHTQQQQQAIAAKPVAAKSPLGSHQAETLREVAAETAEENLRSPRASWTNGDGADLQQYAEDLTAGVTSSLKGQAESHNGPKSKMQSQQDALAIAQNGGHPGQDVSDDGDMDADGDGDMDDDMMDKISSSPSIEDESSPDSPTASTSVASPRCPSEARSSSPYLELPEHLPLPAKTPGLPDGERCGEEGEGAVELEVGKESSDIKARHYHLVEYGNLHEKPHAEIGSPPNVDTPNSTNIRVYTTELHEPRESSASTEVKYQAAAATRAPDQDHEVRRSHEPMLADEDFDYSAMAEYPPLETFDGEVLTVPYEESDEDDDDGLSFCPDASFRDVGWDIECLHETEDIDFEFVYALHTFVATVEGQANATKGDTMVLLDDSNSYWWLVRVVKDSSIGYLPAEHIETPTERLARLNKHRNIDLSATMLGDQAEKSKNPLKSAMRRRKAKAVTFTAPTYIDPSDYEYSSEEEDADLDASGQQAQQQANQQTQQQQQEQQAIATAPAAGQETLDETANVEPLKPKSQPKDVIEETRAVASSDGADGPKAGVRSSEEIFATKPVDGPKRSADGTVRDSFFKDDTVETKKISLTPNLLRDDSISRTSSDTSSIKQRPSFDKLDKELSKDDKKKKDRKEKEKKPGAIRSFFSRKDKKKNDEDDDSFGKRSTEIGDGQEKDFDEDEQPSPEKRITASNAPVRSASKLQKQQPRIEPPAIRRPGSSAGQPEQRGMDVAQFLAADNLNSVANVPPATMRVVQQDSNRDALDLESDRNARPAVAKIGSSQTQNIEARPKQLSKANSRVELDDFDDSFDDDDNEDDITPEPATAPAPVRQAPVPEERQKQQWQDAQAQAQAALRENQRAIQQERPTLPGAYPDSYLSSANATPMQTVREISPNTTPPQQHLERLSESPVHVSPESNPPQLMVDTSSQEEDHSSPRSSPELVEAEDDSQLHNKQDSVTTTSPSTNTGVTWNDANLRAFFDSGSDIRDLLVVVYDKSEPVAVSPDHPIAGSLFKEQNARLAEITTQLDNMLGDWLARKQRVRGAV